MRPAHRVALDDALGRAGGARRIDDVEAVLGLRSSPARARRPRARASRGTPACRAGSACAAIVLAGERGGVVAVDEHDRRAAIGDHRGDRLRASRTARAARRRTRRAACRGTPRHSRPTAEATIATAWPCATPSRCSAAAMRSISASSVGIGRSSPASSATAILSPRSRACARIRSGRVAKSLVEQVGGVS